MRGNLLPLLFIAGLSAVGCIDHPDEPELPAAPASIGGSQTNTPSAPSKPATTTPAAPKATPTLEVLQESVYVLMFDDDGGEFMCTGTLVSKERVITAGHCLERGRFHDYTIVAPLAPKAPRVSASNPTPMSDEFQDVAQPDFGFLTLDEPIELAHYGVLTDVTARVEKGEKLKASTAVRTAEKLEAPLHAVDGLELKSTAGAGYDHGFGVGLFSNGGDSGAGFFLVENGQTSHKLIGVARQPDPDSHTDQLTRVDADVIAWYRENSGE